MHSHFPAMRLMTAVILIAGTFLMTGCGKKLSGTYVPNEDNLAGMLIEKMVFTSKNKVEITAMGMTREGTYVIDGDRVKITINGETNIFTMTGNCIDGGGLLGKFCKK